MAAPTGRRKGKLLRAAAITVFVHCLHAAALFWPAGRADMPAGWLVVGSYALASVVAFLFADRDLITERSSARAGIKRADVVLASLSYLSAWPAALVVAGLDAGRFGWSPAPGPPVQWAALGGFLLGNALGTWAVLTNRFFSTFVRIQVDRGHTVVEDGPYAHVRHPGYAGAAVMAVCLPLALGSLWALVPGVLGAALYFIRAGAEDATLRRELSGYESYTRRVPYRLVPGLW